MKFHKSVRALYPGLTGLPDEALLIQEAAQFGIHLRVISCGPGIRAIRKALAEKFDAIVLNAGTAGNETLNGVLSSAGENTPPVILLLPDSQLNRGPEWVGLGFADFLPISTLTPAMLVKSLFQVIRFAELAREADESHRLLNTVIDYSPVMVFLTGSGMNIQRVNDTALSFLEKDRKQVSGECICKALGCSWKNAATQKCKQPDECNNCLIKKLVSQVIEQKKPLVNYEISLNLKRKGGSDDFHFIVSGEYVRSGLGDDQCLIYMSDITDRVKNEESVAFALARSLRQQETVSKVAMLPQVASGELEMLAPRITSLASVATGISRVSVWLFNADESELRCIDLYETGRKKHSSGAILQEKAFRDEFAALKRAIYVDAEDPLSDPRTKGYVEVYIKPLGITSMLDAVIRSSGRNLGVLCFEQQNIPHRWEQHEITFCCQLADQIALCITNRERRRTELAFLEEKQHFQNLFENTPVATWLEDLTELNLWMNKLRKKKVTDLNEYLSNNKGELEHALSLVKVVDVNKAAVEQNRAASKEQLIRNLSTLFADVTLHDFINELNAIWNGIYTYELVSHSHRLDGSPLTLIIRMDIPVVGNKPDFSRVIITSTDITEMKNTEEELITAKNRAEESDRLKSAFLQNLSHEIRTPMNGIKGFTELLSTPGISDEDHHRYIEIIRNSTDQLLGIVNDLVTLSAIDAGIENIRRQMVNINQLMLDVFDRYQDKAADKKLSFDVVLPPGGDALMLETDLPKLNEILNNLLSNALKFTDQGGVIFGFNHRDGHVEFFVKDTGIGIPLQKQANIFSRFFQAESKTSRRSLGLGIGLSITRSFVEMLGGSIHFETESGKGTTFFFTHPVSDPVLMENHIKQGSQLITPYPGTKTRSPGSRPAVLIADPEEINHLHLRIILEPAGFNPVSAHTLHEALRHCRNNPEIVTIIIDAKILGEDNSEVLGHIRKTRPELPLLITAGETDNPTHTNTLVQSGVEIIRRPFSKEVLMKALMKKLQNKPAT